MIEVKTQAQYDKAIKKDPNAEIKFIGGTILAVLTGAMSPTFYVTADANVSIVTWGTSAPRIVTRETSAPRIETRETSAPRIETRETSAPRIETRETSAPSIETRETSAPRIETRETSAPRIETRETSAPRIETRETSAPSIETRETSAPRIVTRGTSAPRIVTWGTSAPSIETRGTSAPRIETRETSAPRIVTWETSAPRIDANGFSMLRIRAAAKVKVIATDKVFINWEGAAEIIGGTAQEIKRSDPQDWCDYHGVKVVDGVATLYKALNKGFKSPRGGDYTPGTTPRLSSFRAEPECAPGALYFSPTPRHARQFLGSPAHYVACPVLVSEIVTHVNGDYPEKVKAIGCCGPVYEVDVNGDLVNQESAA